SPHTPCLQHSFPTRRSSDLFSAKSFFFAERELLFRFDGGQFYSALPEAVPQVLFGVHACDLVAVAYQDRFFAADPHYQARRQARSEEHTSELQSRENLVCRL